MKGLMVGLLFLIPAIGCTAAGKKGDDALIKRGKALYQGQCTACHNPDPKKDGPLGPASYGASLELLTARIKSASYPAGYKPKRDTKLMVAMPNLSDDDIKAIHAYLNNKK